jgi:putative membrane protein
MRSTLIIAVIASVAIGSAIAQPSNPSADPGKAALPQSFDLTLEPSPPAIKTTEGNNPGAPVPGANSFTEDQAKARIESRGYSNVTNLVKDDTGIWRGKAQKDQKAMDVSLDFQGNVTAR